MIAVVLSDTFYDRDSNYHIRGGGDGLLFNSFRVEIFFFSGVKE